MGSFNLKHSNLYIYFFLTNCAVLCQFDKENLNRVLFLHAEYTFSFFVCLAFLHYTQGGVD